jgi:chromosome partitioning protein
MRAAGFDGNDGVMKTLLVATQKGGVGKSAVLCQFAHYLHFQLCLRVLVIDLDDQGNSSRSLERAQKATAMGITASTIFMNDDVQIATDLLPFSVVKADEVLRRLVEQPDEFPRYQANLRRFLDVVAHSIDVCLIDCAPTADLRTVYAQSIADFMLSPIQLSQEAVEGVAETINGRRGVRRIQATLNPALQFIGILPNMVEQTPVQQTNGREVAARFATYLIPDPAVPGRVLTIPRRSSIAEAQAGGLPLWELGRTKTAARDAWREVLPCFEAIGARMQLETDHGA